jgi:hypothetical protein
MNVTEAQFASPKHITNRSPTVSRVSDHGPEDCAAEITILDAEFAGHAHQITVALPKSSGVQRTDQHSHAQSYHFRETDIPPSALVDLLVRSVEFLVQTSALA